MSVRPSNLNRGSDRPRENLAYYKSDGVPVSIPGWLPSAKSSTALDGVPQLGIEDVPQAVPGDVDG